MQIYSYSGTAALQITIYNFNGGQIVDPDQYPTSTPTVTIYDSGSNVIVSGVPTIRLGTGVYAYNYNIPATGPSGEWRAEWYFTIGGFLPDAGNRTEYFKVVEPGLIQYDLDNLVNVLRVRLKDTHPDYHKQRWVDAELKTFLENALWDINVSPPETTYFMYEGTTAYYNFVPDWKGLIMEGAVIFSLIAQGIFEMGKEFSFSDNGISITLDRAGKYQSMAAMLFTSYENKKADVKKNYSLNSVRPMSIISDDLTAKFAALAPMSYRFR
jgi:hypothetical protein